MMLVILVSGLALTLALHAPAWLLYLFAGLVFATVLSLLGAFGYFMLREPSILRSEDYFLAKHAMDKGLFTPEIAREIFSREQQDRHRGDIELGYSANAGTAVSFS